MYALQVDQNGKIKTIRQLETPAAPSGDPHYKLLVAWDEMDGVPTGVEDPLYKRFVRWSNESISGVDLHNLPVGWLFLGVVPLVAYCKKHGLMLLAETNHSLASSKPVESGVAQFCGLRSAWAFDALAGGPEPASGLGPGPVTLWVPESLLGELNAALGDEDEDVRRISTLPIERTFVYLDVSDFSKYKPGQQALVINSLVGIINNSDLWRGHAKGLPEKVEAQMCIGDGYIFAFKEAGAATYFAAYLAHLLEVLVANRRLPVSLHFRMGVHLGPVYSFWDPGRKDWNYIGEGINGGNRVLSAIDKGYDDILFISDEVKQALMRGSGQFQSLGERLLPNLHNRGRRPDKHGRTWRVYEVSHSAACSLDLPASLPEPG